MSDPSIELRLMASAHSLRKSSDKTMKLAADLQDEAAARIRELEQQLADRDARMSKLEAFVEEVRKVLDYEDWHPSEWHRFLRHSIPSAAAEGGGA